MGVWVWVGAGRGESVRAAVNPTAVLPALPAAGGLFKATCPVTRLPGYLPLMPSWSRGQILPLRGAPHAKARRPARALFKQKTPACPPRRYPKGPPCRGRCARRTPARRNSRAADPSRDRGAPWMGVLQWRWYVAVKRPPLAPPKAALEPPPPGSPPAPHDEPHTRGGPACCW